MSDVTQPDSRICLIVVISKIISLLIYKPLMVKDSKMRLLFVQYAGDYREAVRRFAEGGSETYYAQKYSVDAVAEIAKQIEEAAVLCCITEEPYNEVLQNGVRAIGGGFNKKIPFKKLINLIEGQNPTHLIVCTPLRGVLHWAIQNKVQTIAVLADSFSTKGLRQKMQNYFLSSLLNNKRIKWVFNHGLNSCLALKKIGVKANKIIPWDWPYFINPDSFSPKAIRGDVSTWNLVYVGSIRETKGVGDILEALAKLKAKNLSVNLKIAGGGETEYFLNKARQLKIEDCVEFLGLVPNNTVVHLMREADVVLVPSRHEYPEGFPLTIYEALCSRTPLIASDHPMFLDNLKDGISALIFLAGNSTALSDCIEKLLSDPELYRSLSEASKETWKRLQIPVKWAEMINRWLDDSPENQQWLFEHRLSSGRYDSRRA
jgi:glycosyltransferase involved in cell wall biosynthesis